MDNSFLINLLWWLSEIMDYEKLFRMLVIVRQQLLLYSEKNHSSRKHQMLFLVVFQNALCGCILRVIAL